MTELKSIGFVAILTLLGVVVLFAAHNNTTGMVWYQEVKCPEVYPTPGQSLINCQNEVMRLCDAVTPAWPTMQSRFEPCWKTCYEQGWNKCYEYKFMEE